MRTLSNSTIRSLLGGCLGGLLIGSASLSHADDTEIFFGGPSIDSGIRPNVLFILDNSGSMAWRTASNNTPSGSEKSRLQILKDSFSSIINSAGAINAGIMVLNPRSAYGNTRMVYPVSYLDEELPITVSQVASTPQILESGDDATQGSLGGGADIAGTSLQMGYFNTSTQTVVNTASELLNDDAFFQSRYNNIDWSCRMDEPGSDHRASTSDACGNTDRTVMNIRSNNDSNNSTSADPIIGTSLLYFRNLNLPAAVRLDSTFKAYLDLRPTNTQSGNNRPTITVTMQNSKTPGALNSLTNTDPGRSYLSPTNIATDVWSTSSTTRLDLTDLFKQVLATDASSLQQVFLKLRATAQRDFTFCTRNCGTTNGVSNAPRLVIEYSGTTVVPETKSVALRFQNVGIPQGATIQSARIDFAPATTNSDPLTLQVRAEKVADASIITAGSDVMARTPKTTAVTTWAAPAWTNQNPAVHVAGPTVTSLVQEVVNTSSWCGNNAMAFFLQPSAGSGSRTAFSIEGANGLQPTLTVTYTGGTNGCLNPIIDTTVNSPKDDAYQASTGVMTLDGTSLPVKRSAFGARFTGVPLINGATILDARLIITPANNQSIASAISTTLRVQNSADPNAFSGANNDISSRSYLSAGTCSITSWSTGAPVVCAPTQLKSSLQTLINNSTWTQGKSLLITSTQSSDTNLLAQAFEGNAGQAIKLRLKVASGGLAQTPNTVRKHLNALVQSMTSGDGTPLVPTLYEASQYLRGNRSGFSSPITSACQPTHIVLLTDGQANGNDNTTRANIATAAGSCSVPLVSTGDDPGIADTSTTDTDEQCGRKLAEWLAVRDQSSLDGDSFINTQTIGFALGALSPDTSAQKFLSDLADNGNGGAYTAENANELTKAFSDILQSVQDVDTTFVSASAPVNSFERSENKDELYFSLFSPQESHRWPGNLKRYRFEITDSNGNINPRIVDQDGVGAVDPQGFFKSTAKSFWSTSADGNDSSIGGAASKLPAPASRKLYTYTGTSPTFASPANLTSHLLTAGNSNITKTLLGDASMTDSYRTDLLTYIRGTDPSNAAIRQQMGDPTHSSPKLATYSCITVNPNNSNLCDKADQTAFIGTNEGFIQAVNTDTGVEQFAFMPQELLKNIRKLKENGKSSSLSPRPYGMDSPVTLWVNDANSDGKIQTSPTNNSSTQSGEFVYAYATMGRGGRGLYALDVTNRDTPKLLWYIIGGTTPGFEKLGQTWSTPVKSKIKVGSTVTDVLIFAGGYDESQDGKDVRSADSYGNALYVVNAKTGALIWSASNQATNSSAAGHRQMSKMLYSMPGRVRVVDMQTSPTGALVGDPDRLSDQIFVGDLGGQVWRFYINNGATGAGLITAGGTSGDGIFATAIPTNYASLDLIGQQQNFRRFYNEPDVALLNKDGKLILTVNIGSGYRGHPLNTLAEDIFYSFRTSNLTEPSGNEGTIEEDDLLDVTTNLAPTEEQSAPLNLIDNRVVGGWLLRLTNLGEKVLTRALTAGYKDTLFFSTYQPAASTANTCKASFGTSRAYIVDLLDGSPAFDLERVKVLKVPGIPPNPELFCSDGHCFVVLDPSPPEEECTGDTCDDDPCKGGGTCEVDTTPNGKMYWIDRNGN